MKLATFLRPSAFGVVFLSLSAVSLVAWSQAGTGSRFRVTSKMEMAGFSMPGQTNEVCGPKNGNAQSLVPKQDNCRVENYRASGNKVTYNMVCTGKDATTGRGEFEMLGPDAYRGKMVANVEGETMTMSFEGRRIGDCNYATESPQAKVNAMLGKSCGEILVAPAQQLVAMSHMFAGANAMCAAKEPAYCSKVTPLANDLKFLREQQQVEDLQVKQGLNQPGYSQWDAFAACGLPRATVTAKACAKAESVGDLDFIGALCPDRIARVCASADANKYPDFVIDHCGARADALAKQHCTSRAFTAGFEGPYSAFCNRYAAKRLDQRNPAEAEKPKKPTLRDRLRGVIGG